MRKLMWELVFSAAMNLRLSHKIQIALLLQEEEEKRKVERGFFVRQDARTRDTIPGLSQKMLVSTESGYSLCKSNMDSMPEWKTT